MHADSRVRHDELTIDDRMSGSADKDLHSMYRQGHVDTHTLIGNR